MSFRNTKICILRLPLPSARRGKIHEHALSMFLSKFVISDMILFKHIMLTLSLAHQMSTFLGIRLHCWKMFGLSQLLDNTNTSSLPRLTLIRSRLSVLKVAELSMKGTPWYVARNQRQSSGEYGLKLQPRSGSATFEDTYCKNNLFQQKNLTCASSTAI